MIRNSYFIIELIFFFRIDWKLIVVLTFLVFLATFHISMRNVFSFDKLKCKHTYFWLAIACNPNNLFLDVFVLSNRALMGPIIPALGLIVRLKKLIWIIAMLPVPSIHICFHKWRSWKSFKWELPPLEERYQKTVHTSRDEGSQCIALFY